MRIFVSIASYCDPVLPFTLQRAQATAHRPERLHFGVVDQRPLDEPRLAPAGPARLSQVRLAPLDARGPCWARAIAMSLHDGEEWFLQLDSHMDFDPGWDERLIEQARTTVDEATRLPVWHRAERIIHEDQPYTFMFNIKQMVFLDKRFAFGDTGLDQATRDVSRIMFGVDIQCARCHHHPFEQWSQDDYYSLAAFFSQVGRKPSGTRGEDLIFHKRGIAVANNMKTGLPLKPAALGDAIPEIAPDEDPRLRRGCSILPAAASGSSVPPTTPGGARRCTTAAPKRS